MERTISRRRFVRVAATGAGLIILGDPLLQRSRLAVAQASDIAFSQGVASGEPTQNAITLWTHLDGLDAPARVAFELSDDPGFGRILAAGEALADPADGGAARVRVEGLAPGTQAYYRFTSGGVDSPVGRLRTVRPPDSAEPTRIAVFSCQEFIAGHFWAHRDLAAQDDIDLVVCLGDYIYEQAFATTLSIARPVRTDNSVPSGEAETLDEYRAKYALYHGDADLRAVRQQHSLVGVWDDHEVEDNYAGLVKGGAAENRRLPFATRRANAYRAFFEAMPRLRDPAEADRIYRSIPLGAAELFLLDTRQYRTNQVCDPSDGALQLGCPPQQYNRKFSTLLGAPQKTWLKSRLKTSPAPWKVIGTQVMIMSLDASPGWPLNTDAWDGYGAERAELIDHLEREGIEDVTFLAGDIHTFFAGSVSRTGRARNTVAGRSHGAFATEFVCGSITSPGISDRFASNERDRRAVSRTIDGLVLANNPHMAYSNQAYKGYGLLTASSQELRVEYRAARDIRSAKPDVFRLAEFRVPRGIARVERTFSAYPLAPRGSGPLPAHLSPSAIHA
ncbi:MAG: alkaline phosphatase D family protein [Solirubrobacteraceae bacterium]|nr:alkaline phosphatase D family protein [Solirubrobacteraceae bacterium]